MARKTLERNFKNFFQKFLQQNLIFFQIFGSQNEIEKLQKQVLLAKKIQFKGLKLGIIQLVTCSLGLFALFNTKNQKCKPVFLATGKTFGNF